MEQLIRSAQSRLAQLPVAVALRLPDRRTVGLPDPAVILDFARWRGLALLVAGNIGPIADGFVQGSVRIDGAMRHVMAVAAALLPGNPADTDTRWWRNLLNRARARPRRIHRNAMRSRSSSTTTSVTISTLSGWTRSAFIHAPITRNPT